ncbi:unnamed protein product, partial [Candidula unifasciata]
MKTLRSALLFVLFIYCFSGANSSPVCNQTYALQNITEEVTPVDKLLIDVANFCPKANGETYTISGVDVLAEFEMQGSQLHLKKPDAEAKLSSDPSEFANPWTVVVNVTDVEGNFTFLTVLVRLISINDNKATFTNLSITNVTENTSPGKKIGGCTLSDADYPDNKFNNSYVEIVTGNEDGVFAVDEQTCDIIVVKPLSYANKPSYILTFRAFNFPGDTTGTTGTKTVYVLPVSVYPPRCSPSSIVVAVMENTTVKTVLGQLNCTTFDGNKNLDYFRDSPSSIPYLDVKQDTGEVFLDSPLQYDNTGANNLKQIIVKVVPKGTQGPDTKVTFFTHIVGEDNHAPQFTLNLFKNTISANETVGTPVLGLSATDADAPYTYNSKITYGLNGGCSPDSLVIDSNTGILYLNATLDTSRSSTINCTVYAFSSDNVAKKSFADVNIAVIAVNKPPHFLLSVYAGNVTENSNVPTFVLNVNATDPENGTLIFSFPAGQMGTYWPFKIEPLSGEVSVANIVDFEAHKYFFGPVVVSDQGTPPLDATAQISIEVVPKNEYPPEVPSAYSVSINKLSKPGTLVVKVAATEKDDGYDGQIEFILEDLNVPFVLDPVTGNLTVGIGLDQTTNTFFNLTVKAVDKSKTKVLSSKTFVYVTCDKPIGNNNDPICNPQGPYLVTPTAPPVGDPIGYLSCYDAESGTNLKYEIIKGNTNMFTVVTFNGTIRLAGTPIAGSHTIDISVSDQGSPPRVAIVSVQINIMTNLKFTNLPTTLPVYENSTSTALLFTVKAEGSFDLITYAITGGNTEGKFYLGQSTGDLKLIRSVDREMTDSYTLQITATATDGQSVKQNLGIGILDINDNAPRYYSSFASRKISEKMAFPSTIAQYTAYDLDILQNAEIDYSILSGDPNNVFRYTSTGALQLVKQLDYETQSFYPLLLCGTDRGDPKLSGTVLLNVYVIDEDDNNFKIVSSGGTIQLSVPEDATLGAPIIRIQLQNNDSSSNLTFAIVNGNSKNNFTIDERTGEVYLIFALDRETADFLTLTIRVNGISGKTDTTILNITITDVNDNKPVYNPDNYLFLVPYGTSAGTAIGTLSVTDSDAGVNKDITLSITSANTNNAFRLSGTTLIAASLLNSNLNSQYDLQIMASDHGMPIQNSTAYVTVSVGPKYEEPYYAVRTKSISIEETRTVGSLIDDADATFLGAKEPSSPNPGDLLYILSSGDSKTFFVEQDIGETQLASALNFSLTKSYQLIITAFNKYNRSKSDNYTLYIAVIQMNRFSPVLSKDMYLWDVRETAAKNTIVGQVSATDNDSGNFGTVKFSIEANSNFDINSSTGVVTLIGSLEYSVAKMYCLSVKAVDNAGINSMTAIGAICIYVLDDNNHNPVVINAPFIVTVPETLSVGSVFLTIAAEDLDSGVFGTVSFTIISGNSEGKFALNSKTGAVTLVASLDFETTSLYVLTVRAQDGGSPALENITTYTVHVSDQNDNRPDFGQARTEITIASDTPLLTPISKVSASDKDSGANGEVSYIIESGDDDHLFSIDTVSGVISVAASLASARSFHTLTVAAVDHGVPSLKGTITVAIVIRPVQQSPGLANYVFSIRENEAAGTLVGTIPRDTSLINITSYTISGGNIGSVFGISKDGVLRTTSPLDRETYAFYRLVISISADVGSKVITANIIVTDDNDNGPVFNISVLYVQVVENLPAGYAIATLIATDADADGVNNQVDMFISPYNPPVSTYFILEPPGTIKLKAPINYEDITSFVISVVAADRGSPQMVSRATVYVQVINVTEKEIYNNFQTTYFKYCDFPDDAVYGDVVCALTSADFGLTLAPGDRIIYTTVGDNSVFEANPSTGYVLVKRDWFISKSTRYFQSIIATVTSGGNATSYTILVRLDTFNRNEHLVSVKVNTYLSDLNSQRDSLEANLQGQFPSPQDVVIWQTRSTDPDLGRRRLLAPGSEALVVVEADKTVNSMANITRTKTFLSSKEAAKALQQSSDGTPVSTVASGPPSVASVQPYYTDDDDGLDPAYIALIVVGSLVALAIIAGIIALIIYCCCYRRKKGSEKKRLVEKKKKSKKAFGNLDKS